MLHCEKRIMGILTVISGVLVGLFIKEVIWAAAREWLLPWYTARRERRITDKWIKRQFTNPNRNA